jgi:hypothetical protein
MDKAVGLFACVGLALLVFVAPLAVHAEDTITIVPDNELPRIIPGGFYFDGQSAATQMRNAAAVRVGMKRHVIAALVDTSGYATDVRAKCEGFFMADIPVRLGGKDLPIGVYAFGFTKDSLLNIFDLGGNQLFSVKAVRDNGLRTPKPLTMAKAGDGIRLYRARDYVVIAMK